MISDEKGSERLRQRVFAAYSAASREPAGKHAFPVGRAFAKSLGYPVKYLERLPRCAVDAFSGVSNVSIFAKLPVRGRILDLGCGAGMDSLIASERVGNEGSVLGLDFSADMLCRARQAADQAGLVNIAFCRASAEHMPIKTAAIDVALVNGIFNLNPWRAAIFGELARVIRPGGSVYAAELILRQPLPADVLSSEDNWFA